MHPPVAPKKARVGLLVEWTILCKDLQTFEGLSWGDSGVSVLALRLAGEGWRKMIGADTLG